MSTKSDRFPGDDDNWLAGIKQRIVAARQRAALAANAELIGLYWQIGHEILERQAAQGWGSKVIERLARDLRVAFPDMRQAHLKETRHEPQHGNPNLSRARPRLQRCFGVTWRHFPAPTARNNDLMCFPGRLEIEQE